MASGCKNWESPNITILDFITAENESEPGELEMIYKRDCRHNVSVRKNVPSRYAATDKDERGDE